ncbi:MAG: beta-N-acetylhexosaminidase [Planctomycetaceae bacterium]|nr:beta-N-acetylhexosaminidase [Planctomycetaceae bacterium]
MIPSPAHSVIESGSLTLGPRSRIVAATPALGPLAKVLAKEIVQLTGLQLAPAQGAPREGDIAVALDAAMAAEAYELTVGATAAVCGGSYAAVAMGTATLLQALRGRSLPHMQVQDRPVASYRGLLIDTARRWHTLDTLKKLVVLCRLYKINHMQLHLTDDQSFTFPSRAYPALATPDRHYTLDQIAELESFARERGVAILPELEMPGHAAAAVGGLPSRVACEPSTGNVLCPSHEQTYETMDTLIGEMCQAFPASPYFHIGADEVNKKPWESCTRCKAFMAQHGIENTEELYRHFIVRMNEIVKRHGRKMIVWEGFAKTGKIAIPTDITVMIFESYYNLPPDVLAGGYPVINASWQPLYVVNDRNWTPEHIYGWNMYRWEHWFNISPAFENPIQVPPTNQIIGAQMCAWEQPDELELPSLRHRVPAMAERLWNPQAGRTFADFESRLKDADAKLDKLLA